MIASATQATCKNWQRLAEDQGCPTKNEILQQPLVVVSVQLAVRLWELLLVEFKRQ